MQGMLEALRADWARQQQQEAALREPHSRSSVSVATSPGQPGEVQRLQAQIDSLQEQLQEAGEQLVLGPAMNQLQQGANKDSLSTVSPLGHHACNGLYLCLVVHLQCFPVHH